MDKIKFREYLSCYGSDLKSWPQEAQALGSRARQHPEFAALIEQERQFERLLGEDHVDPAPARLVERIITRSLSQRVADEPRWLFFRLPFTINPVALACILALGFAVGYGAFIPDTQDEEAFLQSYSDDAGAAL